MGRNLQVVSGCTRPAGLLRQYEEQLRDACIPFHLETPISEPANNVGNLGQKLCGLERLLEKFGDCKKLVLSDAWDVLFYGTADDVCAKIPDDGVVLAAERNCWPDAYLAHFYPGETPWRFVNGGLMAGTPESIARWIEAVKQHPAFHGGYIDQQWLNHRLLEGSALAPIDRRAELFYCMAHEAGELQCVDGIPVNTITGTRPNFIHFNGKTDPTMFLWKYAVSRGMVR